MTELERPSTPARTFEDGAGLAFAVVNGVLLRPLGLPAPDRLVMLRMATVDAPGETFLSGPDFAAWRERSRSFDAVAAVTARSYALLGGKEPEQITAARVTADFFRVVGVQPARGRAFLPGEHRLSRAGLVRRAGGALVLGDIREGQSASGVVPDDVVILSHRIWQRRFGGRADVLGQTVRLDGRHARVVGVMPADPGYGEVLFLGGADCLVPAAFDPDDSPRARWLPVLARLRPGISIEAAQVEGGAIARQLAAERPDSNRGWTVRVTGLREAVVGDSPRELRVLMGAVALVLLIACANVANLWIARTCRRHRELATRLALGATRLQLARLLLAETLLVCLPSAALALLLAAFGVRGLIAIAPSDLPRLDSINLDLRVFAFAVSLAIASGVVATSGAMLRLRDVQLNGPLRDGGTVTLGRRRSRLTRLLLVAEVAITLVLLTGAGLLTRTMLHLRGLDLGFDRDHVLLVGLLPLPHKYRGTAAMGDLAERVVERVQRLQGVISVAAGGSPLSLVTRMVFSVRGPNGLRRVDWGLDAVTTDYFRTAGIRFVRGRPFLPTDRANTTRVAVVNRRAAQEAWPGQDSVGQVLTLDYPTRDVVVVGVVEDARRNGLEVIPGPLAYMPLAQPAGIFPGAILVRTTGDPMALASAVARAVREVDSEQPVTRVTTLNSELRLATAERRFDLTVFSAFTSLAFVLALVGIYGVVSYAATDRLREVAVRLVLGAQRRSVLALVSRQPLISIVVGLALGMASALALNRTMTNMVFGVDSTDGTTYVMTAAVWTASALVACLVPAARAARQDPMTVLRYE